MGHVRGCTKTWKSCPDPTEVLPRPHGLFGLQSVHAGCNRYTRAAIGTRGLPFEYCSGWERSNRNSYALNLEIMLVYCSGRERSNRNSYALNLKMTLVSCSGWERCSSNSYALNLKMTFVCCPDLANRCPGPAEVLPRPRELVPRPHGSPAPTPRTGALPGVRKI